MAPERAGQLVLRSLRSFPEYPAEVNWFWRHHYSPLRFTGRFREGDLDISHRGRRLRPKRRVTAATPVFQPVPNHSNDARHRAIPTHTLQYCAEGDTNGKLVRGSWVFEERIGKSTAGSPTIHSCACGFGKLWLEGAPYD